MLYGPGFFVMVCKNANIKPLSFQVLVANVSSVDEFITWAEGDRCG